MFRKFFPRQEEVDEPPVEGSPFFEGKCVCCHCGGKHAQWGRFTLDGNVSLTFCTPECAAAYNISMSGVQGRGERHERLEQMCGRRIEPAPPRQHIKGIDRSVWLPQIRGHLSVAEWEKIQQEMVVKSVEMKKSSIWRGSRRVFGKQFSWTAKQRLVA